LIDLKVGQGVGLVHGGIALLVLLNIFLPDARLAMLSVPIMTRDSVGVHSGVAPLGGVTVVHQPAYGSTGQGGDGHHCADDGERRNDLPPHFYLL